jgi:adenylate cyclase, class 2
MGKQRTKSHATNREIEVKLRVERVDEMLSRISRLGAAREGRVLERNTLYDTPQADFRRLGRLLRIRIETPAPSGAIRGGRPGAVVTAKAPVPALGRKRQASRYKEKLEREVEIRKPREFRAALRAMGLRPSFRYEKYRATFRLRGLAGLHLCLDETPAGTFLELEGSPREIERAAQALGFAPRDYIRGSYWDVYAADCRRRGVKPRNMVFDAKKIL